MKISNIISILSGLLLMAGITSCEGEKDLIIIDGDLPIKTSTLYMIGDATPNGWSLDAATPFEAGEEDPLVFTWEGPLNGGELKLCLKASSFDEPFIRPLNAGTPIGKAGIAEAPFKMNAGDPDDKWKVTDPGIYNLRFDLRNWTMSASFVREQDAPVIEPIEVDQLYIVGDAIPTGWDIDSPTELEKKSQYIYVYEGTLDLGEFKVVPTTGSWSVPFIRPAANGVNVNKNGVAVDSFIYTAGPDNKWLVTESGIYRLTFDLENWTITAEYIGEYVTAPKLYMIGEATDGGWSWDNATVIEATASNENVFVWEGELGRGSLKAAREKDFDASFYRPATPDCVISETGAASDEMVFTTGPDDQWKVTAAGKYRLTFDTENMKFKAEYLDGTTTLPSLYMIGDATAGGWSLDNATTITTETENLYIWEGVLKQGDFKASFYKDFDAEFYRPAAAGCMVSKSGVTSNAMVLSTTPDDKWTVTDAGKYRLTFNITEMTFDATFIEDAEIIDPLYMIGDATPNGWSLDDATEFTPNKDVEGEYVWTGTLKKGEFKACSELDFGASFYRPSSDDCEVSASGVTSNDMIYTTGPDYKWKVVTEGNYRLTLNIKSMTIDVKYLD